MKVKLILPYGNEAEIDLGTLDGLEEILYNGRVYGIKVITRPREGEPGIPTIVLKNKTRDIAFKFGGTRYVVVREAVGKKEIVLTDSRVVAVGFWIMSEEPPVPTSLRERKHIFRFLPPEVVAWLFNAPLAIEVIVHSPAEGGDKVYWSKSMQRHHDYYVFLYRQNGGKLSDEDMAEYLSAMEREKNGEVKPLPEDAVSPFG